MKQLLLPAAAILMAACSGGDKPIAEEKKAAVAPQAPVYFLVDAGTAASLKGSVTFAGVKPARQKISMESDEGCQKATGGKPVFDEPVITGKGGGLANAFVYIQSGLEGKKFPPVAEAVVLDQHG